MMTKGHWLKIAMTFFVLNNNTKIFTLPVENGKMKFYARLKSLFNCFVCDNSKITIINIA